MPPRRTTTPGFITILGAAGIAALIGCVQPDESRPWSTTSRSVAAVAVPSDTAGPVPSPVLESDPGIDEGPAPSDSPNAASGGGPRVSPTVKPAVRPGEIAVVPRPRAEPVTTPRTPLETKGPVVLRGNTSRDRARAWITQAIRNDYSLVRAYAFEAMEHDPSLLLAEAGNGLVDDNRGVRFVATMGVGRAGLETLAPLIEPGLLDESPSVVAASIFALRELGQPVDPSPLAGMAMDDDPEVRGNAYMVLGMLGNRSAIPVIDASLGQGMRLRNPMRIRITQLQAAEALVSLGDQADVEPIRAALFAPVEQGELTVLACDILGRLQDEQALPMLMRLVLADGNERRPAEIRIAAAAAILQLPPPHLPGLDQVILE